MNAAQKTLLSILQVERLETDLFRGTGQGGETPMRIFGGQVIGQALASAYGTVSDRLCHSLHAYFIRPGDPDHPVIYHVDRTRDGGSFTTRRVVAQQQGKQILTMSASFHIAEDGLSHQHPMPDVGPPESYPDTAERRAAIADQVPPKLRPWFLRDRPVEIREVAPAGFFTPAPTSDANRMWFRMAAARDCTPQMQHCLLAYASDMYLLGSSLRPHGVSFLDNKIMAASLDHAMWFHATPAFQNWHLYTMDSPWTGNARGFNRGAIYDATGTLVASTAQEGLLRPLKREP